MCDGIDNDGNGIVDDVDLGGDGVCDCLKIATLGFPGVWGLGDVAADWLPSRTPLTPTALGAQPLTAALLAPFKVIIVEDVRVGTLGTSGKGHGIGRTFSGTEVDALTRWVQAGGGLVTLTGYADSTEVVNVNSLLSPLALTYGSASILASAAVTHWAAHPISAGITSIQFANGYDVQSGGTVLAWEPTPGAHDVGRAALNGQGRVFAWGDEWIAYSQQWPADSQAPRLWLNLLQWLAGAGYCQVPPP